MTIEAELAQVARYRWQRQPQNQWDRWSNFIYPVVRLSGVQRRARWFARHCQLNPPEFEDYCVARWYNHHTARLIERIWTRHPRVRAESRRRQQRDFRLDEQPFDLKTTFPPAALHGAALQAWLADPLAALRWYYSQASGSRFQAAPRLFLVLVDGDNRPERWRRRADFSVLRQAIHQYLDAGTSSYPAIHFRQTTGRFTAPAAEIVCVRFDEVPSVRWWDWAAGGTQVEQRVILPA